MKVLELFSGTGSFSRVAEARGHECRTLDNDKRFNPTYCMDIMDFTLKDLIGDLTEPWYPDIIWASPPCQSFSVMVISKNWGKRKDGTYYPKRPETIKSIEWIKKTLEIIEDLKPKYFFIENPRGMLRKMPFMEPYTRKTVTYCKYSMPYQKATDIWTNCSPWKPKAPCSVNDPCPVRAPKGSRYGIQGVDGLRKNREQKHFDISRMRDGEPIKTYGKNRTSMHPHDLWATQEFNWDFSARVRRGVIPSKLCEEIIIACENESSSQSEGD